MFALVLLFIYVSYASLYDACLEYVETKNEYSFKMDEFKYYLKSYCNTHYTRLNDICEYVVEYIIEDFKDDLLPEYINDELCDIFR
jgi:hypothetical protein